MCASFLIEIRYGLDNFFSSSGTIFTLAGLFLNIVIPLSFAVASSCAYKIL